MASEEDPEIPEDGFGTQNSDTAGSEHVPSAADTDPPQSVDDRSQTSDAGPSTQDQHDETTHDGDTGSHFSSDSDEEMQDVDNSAGGPDERDSQQKLSERGPSQETPTSRSRMLSWDEVVNQPAPVDWADEDAYDNFGTQAANVSSESASVDPISEPHDETGEQNYEEEQGNEEEHDWDDDEPETRPMTFQDEEHEATRHLDDASWYRVQHERSRGYWYMARPGSLYGGWRDGNELDLYRHDKTWHDYTMMPQYTAEEQRVADDKWKILRWVADNLHLHTQPSFNRPIAGPTRLRTMRLNLSPTLDAILDLDWVSAGVLSWTREPVAVPVSAKPKISLEKVAGSLQFHLENHLVNTESAVKSPLRRRKSEPSNAFPYWITQLRARQEQADQILAFDQLKDLYIELENNSTQLVDVTTELKEKTIQLADSEDEVQWLNKKLGKLEDALKISLQNVEFIQSRKDSYKEAWQNATINAESWKEEYQRQNPDAVAERLRRRRIQAGVPPEEYESVLTQTDDVEFVSERSVNDNGTQTEEDAVKAELAAATRSLNVMQTLNTELEESLLAERKKHETEIERLQEKHKKVYLLSQDQARKLNSAESQNQDLVARVEKLEAELKASRRSCAELTTQLDAAQKNLDSTAQNTTQEGEKNEKDQLISTLRAENDNYHRLLLQVKSLHLTSSAATAQIATSSTQNQPAGPALPATPAIAAPGHLLTPSTVRTPAAPAASPFTPLTPVGELLVREPRWVARERRMRKEEQWKRNRDAVLERFAARREAGRLEMEVESALGEAR